ncbi:MAG: hypothetical protein J7K73_03775 [Nanoarchaeota archaeon]|nr:hypothetical protein [Nanoarchaeota archaeon]
MSKRSQLYGISAFMYALAIAVVLIIGMLGLSKDIETSSQAGLYRYNALSAVKAGEIVNKIFDEERGYAVDRSLFITSAFGGYSVSELVCNSTSQCDDYGNCKIERGNDQSECYPNIVDSGGFGCGVTNVTLSFLGEKKLPYWRINDHECIPSIDDVLGVFKFYAGTMFSSPNQQMMNAISVASGKVVNLNYYLDFDASKDVDFENGTISTRWFPIGTKRISFPSPPQNPITIYTITPFVELQTKTVFFDLYEESSNFVANREFEKFLNHPQYSPIPSVIDQDQSIIKHYSNGEVHACDCGTITLKDGETCVQNSSLCDKHLPPFKALVKYIIDNPNLYPNNPNDPNYCVMPDINSLSDNYITACTIYAKKNDEGKLVVDHFEGCDSGNSNDDTAIKCVMNRIISRINKELLSGPVKKNVASNYWGVYVGIYKKVSNDLAYVSCDGNLDYDECAENVVDGRLDSKRVVFRQLPADDATAFLSGDPVNVQSHLDIVFQKPEYIDTIRIYTPDPGYRSGVLSFMGSLDGTNWQVIGKVPLQDRAWNVYEFPPTKVRYLLVAATKTSGTNLIKVYELQVLSSIDFSYLINEFNLTYNGATSVSSLEYNATDMQTGYDMATNAPPFVNPEPKPCSDAVCGDTTYCSNFPGEACPCCGEGIGGYGLTCCDAQYASSALKNKCVDPGVNGTDCHGYITLTLNTTSVYEGDWVRATVTGFCNGCEGKASGVFYGTTRLCVATIGSDGKGECVFRAGENLSVASNCNSFNIVAYSPAVEGGSSSVFLEVCSCGNNAEPACHSDWTSGMYDGCYDGNARAQSTYSTGSYSYVSGYCYTCGGTNQICCDNVEDGAPYDNNKCDSGYCTGGNTPECVPCGTKDIPKCPYNVGNMYNGCYNTNPPLAPDANGTCRECGYGGEICCDNEFSDGYYDDGKGCYHVYSIWGDYLLTCDSGTCVHCGSDNEIPCPNCTGMGCYWFGIPTCFNFDCSDATGEACYDDTGVASDGTCQRCNKYCSPTTCNGTMCNCPPTQCTTPTCIGPDDTSATCTYHDWCLLCNCGSCGTYTCESTNCSPNCDVCGNEYDDPI